MYFYTYIALTVSTWEKKKSHGIEKYKALINHQYSFFLIFLWPA